MHHFNRVLFGALVAVALAGCRDPLTVENTNNPDRRRALARATDVEALLAGAFKTAFNATWGSNGIAPPARSMSWENASNLANWGMGPRSAIPRAGIDNGRGNPYQDGNQADFRGLGRAARAAADGINSLTAGGLLLPTQTAPSAKQQARALAFGWLSLGFALGYAAMDYDSSTIVWPYDPLDTVMPLSGYADVNVAAIAALDSAIKWATTEQTATGSSGFPTPVGWLYNNAIDNTAGTSTFMKLCNFFQAYFRANVARTPTERAAVDWAAVRDDALAGLTATMSVTTGGGQGWGIAQNQVYVRGSWGQLNQLIGGMADSTGAQFEAWLAAATTAKVPFVVRTVDRRFPQGTTRAAQQTASGAGTSPIPTGVCALCYYKNRNSGDEPADPFTSYYDFFRTQSWYNPPVSSAGPTPVFLKETNDLLLAEAYIRRGEFTLAAPLIDISRTRNSLPALAGAWAATATLTTPVPGGSACVPRIPVGPTYTTTACGTILEALKWEWRMETAYMAYIAQWHAGRGWGDLPEGSVLHWPVPYQEMDSRGLPFYNLGGVNNPGGAVGKGTYGF